MEEFVYRLKKLMPSGHVWVKYATNPEDAEELGGVITCRSSSNQQSNATWSLYPKSHKFQQIENSNSHHNQIPPRI